MTFDHVATFPRRQAATRRFQLGAPRSFAVSDDGGTVVFLRSAGPTDPINNLWAIDRGDDGPRLLFDAQSIEVDGDLDAAEQARRERAREQAGGVVSFDHSTDMATVVFVLGGRVHLIGVATGVDTVLESAADPFDPRVAPTGDQVAYVAGRGMRVTSAAGDRAIPGTLDESETVSWGSAEFVAAEEMGRTRGFWWSPDGSSIAATRVDTDKVQEWWIASPESPEREPRPIRYPAAGTNNAEVELWIVDPGAGPQREIDWRNNEFEYLADVRWAHRLLCTVQTRDQRTLAVLAVDADTGRVEELLRLTDPRWVELVSSPRFVGTDLAMVVDSESVRSLLIGGHNRTGSELQVRRLVGVTGEGDVLVTVAPDPRTSVLALVESDGSIDFLSDPESFVSATAAGGTVCITRAGMKHSPHHQIRWADGSTVELESLADEPGFDSAPSFHVLGKRALHTVLCLPSGHDGSPLPVLLDPYAGPHAQRVLLSRNSHSTSQWFAEQGFAVVITDGRGTPGRGPAFEREVWGDLAAPVLADQIEAVHSLASARPELDLTRVGIRGWSFGGYLAALAVLRRPDVFHAAVAGAPVTEWRLYDTHYTERYLGHPDTHPEHYERSSLIGDANRLERPLMLIHGLADDNVVAAHTLALSRALLEAGRAHTVLPLSGVTHMTPQEEVAENLLLLQRDFLRDSLGISAH